MSVCPANTASKTVNSVKVVLVLLLPFLGKSEGKLNVFLEGKEVSRFLYDLNTNLFLVKDGTVAPILKTPFLSSLIPPIEPYIKDLKFRFNATEAVRYRLSFQSSNETIMNHPMASIPLSGLVPQKTKGFRVKFPCTGQVTGETLLTINISFFEVAGSKIWGPLSLVLKRFCVSDREPSISVPRVNSSEEDVTPIPPPQLCNKRCNKRHVMRRFCLNDFVIKARMESEIVRNGQSHLRVRVQRTFKQSKVKINTRQLLEKRGQEITCNCGNLRPNRVYVILGKEDRRKRVLYLDNFSTALDWSRNGKTYIRAYRKKPDGCSERPQ
ncbi:uncharacterized protein [Montipora foliosa]|uniref:uncharacterized protein n=1 Tax=Montipora foliosa TaxID=591990 RepID=UPI0035F1766E